MVFILSPLNHCNSDSPAFSLKVLDQYKVQYCCPHTLLQETTKSNEVMLNHSKPSIDSRDFLPFPMGII